MKLLGKNHIQKMSDYESDCKMASSLNKKASAQNCNKRSILLNHQMLKKFANYIP